MIFESTRWDNIAWFLRSISIIGAILYYKWHRRDLIMIKIDEKSNGTYLQCAVTTIKALKTINNFLNTLLRTQIGKNITFKR